MRAAVSGIGLWLPERVRHNEEWPPTVEQPEAQRAIAEMPSSDADAIDQICARYVAAESGDRFLGALTRRVVSDDVGSIDAEAFAGRLALEDAGVDATDLDAILSWSMVPDRVSPPSAAKLTDLLGATNAWGMGTDAACASGIVQLEIAASLIESGRARHVLLTQSNLMSRVVKMDHPASPGIGDAASAMVVSASERPGVIGVHAITHGDHYDSIGYVRRGEGGIDVPWYEAGGSFTFGSRNREGMKSLMRNTARFGVETTRAACVRFGVPVDTIDVLACTQPRGWMPAAVAEGLGLPTERAPSTYTRYAHLGASAVMANLCDARERGMLRPGSLVAIYSQGGGFTRAAALVRWKPDEA